MNEYFYQKMFDFVEKSVPVILSKNNSQLDESDLPFFSKEILWMKANTFLKKCFESFEVSVSTRVGLEFCVRSCMALLKSAKFVYIPSLSPM